MWRSFKLQAVDYKASRGFGSFWYSRVHRVPKKNAQKYLGFTNLLIIF